MTESDGTEVAALAQRVGGLDTARLLVLVAGVGRSPATGGFARRLATQLWIADHYAAEVLELQPGNPDGAVGGTRSLNALRTEPASRCQC